MGPAERESQGVGVDLWISLNLFLNIIPKASAHFSQVHKSNPQSKKKQNICKGGYWILSWQRLIKFEQQWRIKGESPGMIPKPLMYYINYAVIYQLLINLGDLWLEVCVNGCVGEILIEILWTAQE